MLRNLFAAIGGLALIGAAPAPVVEYRLGLEPQKGAAPVADVEIRFRGDASGQTRLALPDSFGGSKEAWRYLYDLKVKGAEVQAPDPAHRLLRYRPGATVTVRYRVRTAYDSDPPGDEGNAYRGPLLRPDWFALLGDYVFAVPEGHEHDPADFRWAKAPKGWRLASDLEHGRMGRPMTVDDVVESISMGGSQVDVLDRASGGAPLRLVRPSGSTVFPDALADDITKTVEAQRAFWGDQAAPYLVAMVPLTKKASGLSFGGTGRGDGFVLWSTPGVPADRMRWTIAHEHTHTWIPDRVGRMPQKDEAAVYWLSEGFTDFFAVRSMLRGGLISVDDAVARWAATLRAYDASAVRSAPASRIVADFWKDDAVEQLPYQRGQLLALKWDEAVRRKTGGKADLDTVMRHMRDHYQQFAPGQGPDVVTGFVSAMWVVAGLDVRPDIARYADGGAPIDLPEEMFDGCLQARVTVAPAFDPGFDTQASFAAKTLRGVRRGGPAWNSGLRDGMSLDSWTFNPGDATRQIELVVRGAAGRGKTVKPGKPRKVAFWPYGDADASTRKLQLQPVMTSEQLAACGRKLAGL